MIAPFRPMLAVQLKGDLPEGNFVLSPKFDGIRTIIRGGFPVSRNLKLIANRHVQLCIGDYSLEGFDGELIVGAPTAPDVFNATTRGVMSAEGEPDFKFYVFDLVTQDLSTPFCERHSELLERIQSLEPQFRQHIEIVPQVPVGSTQAMHDLEAELLAQGYEGAMLRKLDSPYKLGRSTEKQAFLLKRKPWQDAEARVIGYECLYSNQNEAKKDAMGLTERSTHKAGMVAQDSLGKLTVRDLVSDVEFSIGSGFTAQQRRDLWADQDNLIGKLITYKFFPIGVIDKPRFPIFKAFRHKDDL